MLNVATIILYVCRDKKNIQVVSFRKDYHIRILNIPVTRYTTLIQNAKLC